MIRKAKIQDVKRIHYLLDNHSENAVIPRSLSELYEHLRDFFVYEEDGEVAAVAALHIAWDDLAEVRSLVVDSEYKGQGLGKVLVKECLNDAKSLGVDNVFVLTFIPKYFEKLDFFEVDKSELPHKVWSDCVKCVKFPDCDETAMMFKFKAKRDL